MNSSTNKSSVYLKLSVPVVAALGSGLFLLAFTSPVVYPIDGNSMLAVAVSIVTKGNVTVPAGQLGSLGLHGQYYSNWYPLLSVLAAPFVAMGVFIAHLKHLPLFYTAGAFALLLPPIATAATAYFVAALAMRLGSSQSGALLGALAFVFGTIAIVYARDFFAEPILALITVASIYSEIDGKARQGRTSTLSALAVLAKPTGVILGPLLAAHAFFKRRLIRDALPALAGTVVGLLMYCLYNFVRFGGVLTFGQPTNEFKVGNLPEGILILTLSPLRGTIWYCPVLIGLIGLRRDILRSIDVWLIAGIAVAYTLLYSSWSFAAGGWCWGPRFLLPTLPGLLALTGLLQKGWRKCLLILTIAGFFINGPTLLSYYYRVYQEELYARENTYVVWSFVEAPYVRIWGAAWRELNDARHSDLRQLVEEAGQTRKNEPQNWRTLKIVNVWWWMLPLVGISRIYGALLSLMMVLAAMAVILGKLASLS